MKITIEHYSKILTVQIPDESTLPEVMDIFCDLIVVDGYAKDCVIDYITEKSNEYES